MRTADDVDKYRERAEECMRLSEEFSLPNRLKMLLLAEEWLSMASKLENELNAKQISNK